MGNVEPSHPDLTTDPLGILHPASKLFYQLALVSAYSPFARMLGVAQGLDHQQRRIDPAKNEPLVTNCTRCFLENLDYMLYKVDSLIVESLRDILDEVDLRKDTCIRSHEWSYDHIELLVEFGCRTKARS